MTQPNHVNAPIDYGNIIGDPEAAFTGNCENIIGFTPVPLGLAGPISFNFEGRSYHAQLPLATTEACLVASVNRGFKALRESEAALEINVDEVGISRSAAFSVPENFDYQSFQQAINQDLDALNQLISEQSQYTKLRSIETELRTNILFINNYYTTGDAMGMNMATIATKYLADAYFKPQHGLELITVSANWCSDKKPSSHSAKNGRKFSATIETTIPSNVIETILKTNAQAIALVDEVKLRQGSEMAGSIGQNAHHANIIAASFIALGQDPAHTVDGSLGKSFFEAQTNGDLKVRLEIPALVCGTVGGGTSLNTQAQTLKMTSLPTQAHGHIEARALAALIACGVLAGELSLMAALASQTLASSHQKFRRKI